MGFAPLKLPFNSLFFKGEELLVNRGEASLCLSLVFTLSMGEDDFLGGYTPLKFSSTA